MTHKKDLPITSIKILIYGKFGELPKKSLSCIITKQHCKKKDNFILHLFFDL